MALGPAGDTPIRAHLSLAAATDCKIIDVPASSPLCRSHTLRGEGPMNGRQLYSSNGSKRCVKPSHADMRVPANFL